MWFLNSKKNKKKIYFLLKISNGEFFENKLIDCISNSRLKKLAVKCEILSTKFTSFEGEEVVVVENK